MSGHDIEKIERSFHTLVFHTGACREGAVVRFSKVYFKIYDADEMKYSVQVWSYNKQMPDRVDLVDSAHLVDYMQSIVHMSKFG